MRKHAHLAKRRRSVVAASILALTPCSALAATTYSWNVGISGVWGTACNWTPTGGPPGAADTAQFNLATGYTVTLDQSPSISSFSIAGSNVGFANSTAGRTFDIASTLFVNSGSLTLASATPVAWTGHNNAGFNANVTINNSNSLSFIGGLGIGATGASNVFVSGTGSTLSAGGILTIAGAATGTSILNYSNNAQGSFSDINIATAGNASATLTVQGGADMTLGALSVGSGGGSAFQIGTVTFTGSGTTINQSSGMLTIGAANASSGSVTVSNSAGYIAGSGITVNPTGVLTINGGAAVSTGGFISMASTSSARDGISISGASSSLTQSTSAGMSVGSASGATTALTLTGGASFSGASLGATIASTGAINVTSSTLTISGALTINAGGKLNFNSGNVYVGSLSTGGDPTRVAWASGILDITGNGGVTTGSRRTPRASRTATSTTTERSTPTTTSSSTRTTPGRVARLRRDRCLVE